jgi:hypothetical protein
MSPLSALADPEFWRSYGQKLRDVTNRGVAAAVGGPVDLAAMVMRPFGYDKPDSEVFGSSEYIGKRMQDAGMVGDYRNPLLEMISSIATPAGIVKGAPVAARAAQAAAANAMIPQSAGIGQKGAIVWHGSPHKFDKFDASKIGTGEGAQAYGHGLYVADSSDIAMKYQPRDLNLEKKFLRKYKEAESRGNYPAMNVYENYLLNKTPEEVAQNIANSGYFGVDLAAQNAAHKWASSQYQKQTSGSLYKIDLPDEHIARMLDWDKPVADQPFIAKALSSHPDANFFNGFEKDKALWSDKSDWVTGRSLYGQLDELFGNGSGKMIGGEGNGIGAANILKQQGIPGIRYLDGGSRGTGAGTSNYVVFPGNENMLRILERNGQPVSPLSLLSGPSAGGKAAQRGEFVYPQQKALDTAQRNAVDMLGLPPNNTPMDRAKALGFDTDLLHGTTNNFPAFSVSSRHSVYATQDPAISDIYANAEKRHRALREINAGPNVIPLKGRGKLLETSDYRHGSGGWLQNNMADALSIEPKRGLTKELPAHGYDGAKVTMDDLGGSQTQFIYPDPKVLRSRFAAFDPARINENDLLGRADPALLSLLSLGAYGAQKLTPEEKRRDFWNYIIGGEK